MRMPCSDASTLFLRIIEAGDEMHLHHSSYPLQNSNN